MKTMQAKIVAVCGAAVTAFGLLSASAAPAPVAGPLRPGPHAKPRPVLGGGRPGIESYAEMRRIAERFAATHQGGLPAESIAAAQLAAFGVTQTMPRALDASLSSAWKEAGPKPYHVDDPAYGRGCALACLQPAQLEQPLSDLGWDRVAGRVTALAIDHTDPTASRLWVGTAGGGVWYSSDAGAHWTPKFDDQPSLAIGALAIDPKDPKTVFVGTGEANTAFENQYGTGVYRTRDNGATWERVAKNIANASTVARIAIAGGRIFVASNKGLYRSVDGGNSYQDVRLPTNSAATARDPGPFSNIVTDVVIRPDDPNEITAVVGWRNGNHFCENKKPICSPGNGLYRSETGGAPGSFTKMDPEGFGAPGRSKDPVGRVSLAYATGPEQDHDIMWAIIQDAGRQSGDTYVGLPTSIPNVNSFNGVYRSDDDGLTWELKATSESLNASPGSGLTTGVAALYFPGVQSWYNQWIAVDPSDPEADRVLLGLEEIYETDNANDPGIAPFATIGRYWNYCLLLAAGPELPTCDKLGLYSGRLTTHPDQHAVAMAITDDGSVRLYAGNDGGVYRQDSDGSGFANDRWTSLNDTLGSTQPYFAVMGSDDTIYAGFQDNGTAKIQPNGRSDMVYGGDGFDVAVDPNDSNIAYEEYVGGTIAKTLDGGREWIPIAPVLDNALFSQPFEMDPMDPNHLVLPARQIAETTKGPDTTCTGDQLLAGNVHLEPLCDWVYSFDLGSYTYEADPSVPLGLSDDTADWQSSAVDVRGADVYVGVCVTCDIITTTAAAGDASRFHNGIATNVADCTPQTGTDACWHVIADPKGLPARYIGDVAIDATNRNIVYVAMAGYGRKWYPPDASNPKIGRGHVFVSRDAGKSFTDLSGNLPDTPANAIVVRGDRLFVGTDVGVFTAPKSGGTWTRLGSAMPNAAVFDLNLNPQGTKLVAATHGRGVWVYDFGAGALTPKTQPKVLPKRQTRNLPATGAENVIPVGVALIASSLMLGKRRMRRP